jgi:NTE family protein
VSLRTHAGAEWFFEGVPADELAPLIEQLEVRSYAAGTVVMAEGDRTREIYIPQSGSAEVLVSDTDGSEHRVGRVVPGGTVGEISLLTGQPAVATVRATTDLEVIVLSEEDFGRIASTFPQIYRNVGIILAERLARTNRIVVGKHESNLTLLEATDAPPLLAYGLACSIAWHTRERALLMVLDEDAPAEIAELATTSSTPPWRSGRAPGELGADLIVAPPTGPCAPESLISTLEALFGLFPHVLIQAAPEMLGQLSTGRPIRLQGGDATDVTSTEGPLTIRGWTTGDTLSRPDRDGLVRVPPLVAVDEQGLRTGLLPSKTPAGRALGWAARDLTGLKVGIALGAGSIRGYAHLGVLETLRSAGLEFDYIAGTSVGAAVAGLFALGNDEARIADILDEFSPNLFKIKVPYTSLLSDRGMRHYLRSLAPGILIEDLATPLALIAADILTQRELVLRRGLLWQAALASIAIPGVYPAQRIGPYVAVDGGVLNPLPANVVGEMGAGTVIAVKLGSDHPLPEHELEVIEASGRPPAALGVLLRAIEIMQRGIVTEPTDATMITISPKLDPTGVGLRNMYEGRRYIDDGVAAAEAALPRVAAALPWLR